MKALAGVIAKIAGRNKTTNLPEDFIQTIYNEIHKAALTIETNQ